MVLLPALWHGNGSPFQLAAQDPGFLNPLAAHHTTTDTTNQIAVADMRTIQAVARGARAHTTAPKARRPTLPAAAPRASDPAASTPTATINVVKNIRGGAKVPDKVWDGAAGLEWTLSSPPPYHSFTKQPVVE